MKFVCDQCNTRYSIPEERVAGKVLKIRCKKCENIITVKGVAQAQVSGVFSGVIQAATHSMVVSAGTAHDYDEPVRKSEPPLIKQVDEWFYTKAGKQAGPVHSEELLELILSRVVGPKTLVWKDGMEDWIKITTIPEFDAVLKEAAPSHQELAQSRPPLAETSRTPSAASGSVSGVFDSLLRDMDHVKTVEKKDRIEPAETAEPSVRKKPEQEETREKIAATPEKIRKTDTPDRSVEAVSTESAIANLKIGEELSARETGSQSPESMPAYYIAGEPVETKQAVEYLFEDENKARRRESKARKEKEQREKAAATVAKMVNALPAPADDQPRESTQVFILKAGLSAKSKVKRYIIAALIFCMIIGGLTLLGKSLGTFKALGELAKMVVAPNQHGSSDSDEANLTPEERAAREKERKRLLGIVDQEEEQKKIVRSRQALSKPTVPGQPPPVDDGRIKDAYAGLSKDEIAPARIELPGRFAEGGIGSLDLGASGAGFEKRAGGPVDIKRDSGNSGMERMSEQSVQRVIAANQNTLRSCYERSLKADSDLSGKVFFRVEVDPEGNVAKVSSLTDRIKGTNYEGCMLKSIKKWQFPRSPQKMIVDLPFVLSSTM